MASVDRSRDAGGRQRLGLHDLQRPGVSSYRAYHAGNGNHRRPVVGSGLFPAPPAGGVNHRTVGDGAAMMHGWRGGVRALGRGMLPFAIILILWALATRAGGPPAILLPSPCHRAEAAWPV